MQIILSLFSRSSLGDEEVLNELMFNTLMFNDSFTR